MLAQLTTPSLITFLTLGPPAAVLDTNVEARSVSSPFLSRLTTLPSFWVWVCRFPINLGSSS